MPDDDFYEPKSKLWRFRDHRDGETASYRMGAFEAGVFDYDGDGSDWWVTYRGERSEGKVRDFREGLRAAEAKLIEIGALHPSATRD